MLAGQIARHCMNDDQRQKLANEVVAAEDFDFLQQLVEILPPTYIGNMLVAAAQAKQWDRVRMFIGSADEASIEQMMELAIDEGNFDAVDLLDEYL